VPKAIFLDKKPKLKIKNKEKYAKLSVESIKIAIKELNLEYKRVDEVDIYNIFIYLEQKKRG